MSKKLLINATVLDAKGMEYPHQALAIEGDTIVWCGDRGQIPVDYQHDSWLTKDCGNQLLTPGLIDCHTHLVYAGNRVSEFAQRLQGLSYAEIAKAGGGILSTVNALRNASEEELLKESLPRMWAFLQEGVTTIEIKSGYGLDLDNELKMLRVARKLGKITGMRVKTTFLGAHAVPLEFKGKQKAYMDLLCQEILPRAHAEGLVDAVDVFCENIAFTVQEAEQLFTVAHALNLPVKCHAEQLSNIGATLLAAQFNALSCDHLEYLEQEGAYEMAKKNTIAVLLPGAYYFLREKRKPPIQLIRDAKVNMAIATDCNPGSSPTTSLTLMMSMACQFFGLTIEESLSGVTYQAACALGMEDRIGEIAVGKVADLILWSSHDKRTLCYGFGYPLSHEIMIAGEWIASAVKEHP